MIDFNIKTWNFPAGERGVLVTDLMADASEVSFTTRFKGSDDIIDIILTVDAIRSKAGPNIKINLLMPYFPYARQDRVMNVGESNSLRAIAKVLRDLNLNSITVWDAHSDVLEGLFPPGVLINIPQHELVRYLIPNSPNIALISPDAGALKKIYKLAATFSVPIKVVECGKRRDSQTGKIIGTTIGEIPADVSDFYVVDDICDGGATFIELAKEFRRIMNMHQKEYRLHLVVSHGIFSKGIPILNEWYNSVQYVNDMRRENV